jgi:hypothetical protein
MTTTETISAPVAAPAASKRCVGCGCQFPAGGRGLGKNYCTDTCRTTSNNRAKAEGAPLAALVKAWNATRHAKPGTREAEICRFARSELTAIAGFFNERDEDAGRASAVDYVASLMDSGLIWADRIRGA